MKNEISAQDFERINGKVQALILKAQEIREKYGWNPSDELKQELLMALQDIIK